MRRFWFVFVIALLASSTHLPLCQYLPETDFEVPEEKFAFGDSRYSEISWKYLIESEPDIVRTWDELDFREQVRIAEFGLTEGAYRGKEVLQKYRTFEGFCREETVGGGDEFKGSRRICDLEALCGIEDADIQEIGFWVGPEAADYIWKKRQGALQLLAHLHRGNLTTDDQVWAVLNLPGEQATLIMKARNALKNNRPDKDRALRQVKNSLIYDGFSLEKASGKLRASSWEPEWAKRIFDGSQFAPSGAKETAALMRGGGAGAAGYDPDLTRQNLMKIKAPPPVIENVFLKTEDERKLSGIWNDHIRKSLKGNPVGRKVHDSLEGKLLPIGIEATEEHIAVYNWNHTISVTGKHLLKEIKHFDPSARVSNDTGVLTRYLLKNPEVAKKVMRSYESTMVHELAHAVQYESFPRVLVKDISVTNLKEQERHAFTIQMMYVSEELKKDPNYLFPKSPRRAGNFHRFEKYCKDYEGFLDDVDSYFLKAPTLAEFARKHGAGAGDAAKPKGAAGSKSVAGDLLQSMKDYYGKFFKDAQRDWQERGTEGLLILVEAEVKTVPLASFEKLVAIKSRLSPDDKEAKLRFQNALDDAVANSSRDLRKLVNAHGGRFSPSDIEGIDALKQILGHLGRSLPADLDNVFTSTCRRKIQERRSSLSTAEEVRKYPSLALRKAQQGLEYAGFIGDKESESFFEGKIKELSKVEQKE